MIFGDYNLPGIQWSNDTDGSVTMDYQNSVLNNTCYSIIDGAAFHNLHQLNATRNHNGRTLDLVFCNSTDHSVTEAKDVLIAAESHHPPLEFLIPRFDVEINTDDNDRQLDFKKTNFDALNEYLHLTDWSLLNNCSDVDSSVCHLIGVINAWLVRHVPEKRKPRYPPWETQELRTLKRKKNASLRKMRRNSCPTFKIEFQRSSRAYTTMNSSCYRNYVRRMQSNLRRNPKSFWSFVNSKRKDNGLPVNMFFGDKHCASSSDKCSLFADRFSSVFNNDACSDTDVRSSVSDIAADSVDVDIFEVSDSMILRAASKLKTSFKPGPDGIPAVVYKKCINSLLAPLHTVFNLSLSQQKFPEVWKNSVMFPVFKKGSKRDIANYRGITSLSAGSKLFEIIVNDFLFFHTKNYISADQHGFFPGRSVTTNLVDFTTTCLSSIEKGLQVDTIYTDLTAAFDRISHNILVEKIKKIGASDRLVNWLRSYLTGRKLRVKIGANYSREFECKSGVPQGSNLGPLLFSMFFNDVTNILPKGCRLLYADDLKIYFIVRDEEDCILLQSAINDFSDWCSRNHMTLSISKCCVISFNRKSTPIIFDYNINGTSLERVSVVKDLGVILDSSLTFNEHTSSVIDKANRQLGFITKISREFTDPYCLKALYCSLVRSMLESADVVWAPYQTTWIERIERVQKRFLRFALANLAWRDPENLPPYQDRCRLLNMDTLEHRRRVNKAVFVAKLLKGEIDSPSLLSQLPFHIPLRILRNQTLLRVGLHRTNYGINAPIPAMITEFCRVQQFFNFNASTTSFKNKIMALHTR